MFPVSPVCKSTPKAIWKDRGEKTCWWKTGGITGRSRSQRSSPGCSRFFRLSSVKTCCFRYCMACGPMWPCPTTRPPEKANMTQHDRVKINKLPTGAQGLDEILGGGLPEFSFNIVAGAPGCGKTTLAHQFVFANATPERPALYFTVLGEPALKMLRYQQQYTFFDLSKLGAAVRFINLSHVLIDRGLLGILDEIVKQVEAINAGFVVVDSFRTIVRKAAGATREVELQGFVQRLALHLTSWQATTFLIGEYAEAEMRDNPVFTVADGLLW